jgi:hypothetical protein
MGREHEHLGVTPPRTPIGVAEATWKAGDLGYRVVGVHQSVVTVGGLEAGKGGGGTTPGFGSGQDQPTYERDEQAKHQP